MNVAGCNGNFVVLSSEVDNRFVDGFKRRLVWHSALFNQKSVVAERLNFKIIVIFYNFVNLGKCFAVHNGGIKLARLARRTENKSLAVLCQKAFRNARFSLEMFQVRL